MDLPEVYSMGWWSNIGSVDKEWTVYGKSNHWWFQQAKAKGPIFNGRI
jgi:hypothetical protein